jgi:hypothetical protein
MVDNDLKRMIPDYMNRGFLDNIIDMLRQDEALYPLIVDMIRDERMRVRLGVTALVEEMVPSDPEPFVKLIPSVAALLQDENPSVRGDAANLLEIIGHKDALPFLLNMQDDTDANVRKIVEETIIKIREM